MEQNIHACLLQLRGKGILIQGKSGSGKTSLLMGLLETFKGSNEAAFLVSDDQVLVTVKNNCLFGRAPETIAGKVEIFGFGIIQTSHIDECKIHMSVHLVDDEEIVRMPENRTEKLFEVEVPAINVPMRHENQAKRIVIAKLATLFD